MQVLHTSDLHGQHRRLLSVDADFDVWLDSGDFFPNRGRRNGGRIEPHVEIGHQARWCRYKRIGKRLAAWLNGRPAITVSGNHDFISLHSVLQQGGAEAWKITTEGFELFGRKWAGFREIPYIDGEWPGEVDQGQLADLAAAVWETSPDILVTHAPPSGILAGPPEKKYGISSLTTSMAYRPHKIKAHFFGHEHSAGGKTTEEMGVRFINGACNLIIHDHRRQQCQS